MSYNELPEYHGYTNYPTWVVELWIDGDRGNYMFFTDVANQFDSTHDFADWLKEFHEENNPTVDINNVYSDLMTWALQYVNWQEIAENIKNPE